MLIHFGDMAPTCEVKRYKLAGEKKCAAHFYVLYVEAEVNGEKRTLLVYYYLLSYKTSFWQSSYPHTNFINISLGRTQIKCDSPYPCATAFIRINRLEFDGN